MSLPSERELCLDCAIKVARTMETSGVDIASIKRCMKDTNKNLAIIKDLSPEDRAWVNDEYAKWFFDRYKEETAEITGK